MHGLAGDDARREAAELAVLVEEPGHDARVCGRARKIPYKPLKNPILLENIQNAGADIYASEICDSSRECMLAAQERAAQAGLGTFSAPKKSCGLRACVHVGRGDVLLRPDHVLDGLQHHGCNTPVRLHLLMPQSSSQSSSVAPTRHPSGATAWPSGSTLGQPTA